MRTGLIFILFAGFVFSCQKIEKIEKAGDITPKIILNCASAEGDNFIFYVHRSLSVLDNASIKPIKTAVVKLFADGVLLETVKYDALEEAYVSNFTAQLDVVYSVEVSAKGYATVTAKTKLPKDVVISSVGLEIKGKRWSGWSSDTFGNFENGKLKLSFKDEPGVRNYYMVEISDEWTNSSGMNQYYSTSWETSRPDVESLTSYNQNNSSYAQQFFFADDFDNGKELVIDFNSSNPYNTFRNYKDSILGYHVKIVHLTEDYSKHIYTMGLTNQNQDNPFQEPVQIFSNVSGGYGIFGAFSGDEKFIKFP